MRRNQLSTIISDTHRFIFFHLYKVAGTSITHALKPFSRPTSKHDKILANIEILFPISALSSNKHHVQVRELEKLPIFKEYFKFGFVRNPWDWQVSSYHFMRQGWKVPKHYHTKLKSFREYIEWRCLRDRKLQYDFLAGSNGEIGVDFVGKLENFNQDWKKICEHIEIDVSVGKQKTSKHDDYRLYYDDYTKDMVHRYFRKDIDFFNYEFDNA